MRYDITRGAFLVFLSICLFLCGVLASYDLLMMLIDPNAGTAAIVILQWSMRWPTIPFLAGLLLGYMLGSRED